MTTLPQADLPQDHGILRAAAQHNQPYVPTLGQAMPSVGVYASVGREGDGAVRASNDVDVSIVEGNQVELLRTQGPQSRTSGLTPRSRSNSSSHRKIGNACVCQGTQAYHWDMSRIHPDRDSDPSDRLVAADVLLRREPDEEEDEEEDEGDGKEDDEEGDDEGEDDGYSE